MIDKIQNLIDKYDTLSDKMSDPNIISDMQKYTKRKWKNKQKKENIISHND